MSILNIKRRRSVSPDDEKRPQTKLLKLLTGQKGEILDDWVIAKLRGDQEKTVNWLLPRNCAILAADMGFGKTLSSLVALVKIYLASPKKVPSLVVAKKSILQVWLDQLKQHFSPQVLSKVVYIEPQTLKGVSRINRHTTWLVLTTYDTIKSNKAKGSVLRDMEFNVAVLDEGHAARNIDTQRFSYLQKIKRRRTWFLTGTPLQNRVTDIISLLILGGAFRLKEELTQTNVKNALFSRPNEIFDLIRNHFLRIEKIEGFDSCELLPYIHARPFTPEEQSVYDEHVFRKLEEEREGDKSSGIGWFQRALHGCAQSQAKKEMIRDIVEKFKDSDGNLVRKIIIFSNSLRGQKEIADFCRQTLNQPTKLIQSKHKPSERARIIREFSNDETHIAVLSFGACTEGLNIQCASVVIFADMACYKPQPFKQGERRCFRPGQKESKVLVYYLVISGTIEAHIPHLHAIKLRKAEHICAAMPFLEDIHYDGSLVNDPDRYRMARVEFNQGLQLEQDTNSKSPLNFSLQSNSQVRKLIAETLSPTRYLENFIKSYNVSSKHRSYLLGRDSFAEDEVSEQEDESRQRARAIRDARAVELCVGLTPVPITNPSDWYAMLTEDGPKNGLFDDWFGKAQGASGLFCRQPFNLPYAKLVSKKPFKVLMVDTKVFESVAYPCQGFLTFERVANSLFFVRNKIVNHSKLHPDADEIIHVAARLLEKKDVFAIGAETACGTLFLPIRAAERPMIIRSWFDRSLMKIERKPSDNFDGFLDDIF